MKRNYIYSIIIIILLVIIDIISKILFTSKEYFKDYGLIYITSSKNFGSSFGLFSNLSFYSYFLIMLATICLFIIFIYRNFLFNNRWLKIAIILFCSGVIGNTIDRILYGYVRDFIGIKYLFILNFADIYISLAFIFYIIYELSENKLLKTKKL